MEMVFTRQKVRLGANLEYPPRNQPTTNICEVCTTSQTVFKREQNEPFIQRVLQYYQEAKGDKLNYLVLGLNESSTEDDMKNPIIPWLVGFNLTKISIRKFLM